MMTHQTSKHPSFPALVLVGSLFAIPAAPIGAISGLASGMNILVGIMSLIFPPGSVTQGGVLWIICVIGGIIGTLVGAVVAIAVAGSIGMTIVSVAGGHGAWAWRDYLKERFGIGRKSDADTTDGTEQNGESL
jgi:hypothetical protein